jgi:hypothetical protein
VKIREIANRKDVIKIYNLDAVEFVKNLNETQKSEALDLFRPTLLSKRGVALF